GSGESTFVYDSLNRMTEATDGSGATVEYQYDLAGRLIGITYPDGHQVSRSYDAAGNLTDVTDWLGHTTHFGYDADSNETEIAYPNGVQATRGFDALGQLESIADSKGGTTLASFEYARDSLGQVTAEEAENGGSGATSFSHDQLGRLTDAGGAPYGYDAADNPTTFGPGISQNFDAAGELLSSVGPAPEGPGKEGGPGEKPEGGTPPKSGGGSSSGAGGGTMPTPPSTLPAVDAVVTGKKVRAGTMTTPHLPAAAGGDLLLAFVSAGGAGQKVTGVSGAGLRWHLVQGASAGGVAEVWEAQAGPGLSGQVTVHLRRRSKAGIVTVVAFSGFGLAVQAHGAVRGKSSKPGNPLRATSSTLVWAVGHSVGQTRPVSAAPGQQLVAQAFDRRSHSAAWVQALAPGASGSVADRGKAGSWTLAAVAIGRAGGAGASSADTFSRAAVGSEDATQPPVGQAVTAALPGEPTLSRQFSYDERGNRISEQVEGFAPIEYRYDQANRLTGVGAEISYSYDGDGLRTGKTVEGLSTQFVWNQAEEIPELLQEGETEYIYGPGGEAIEQVTAGTATYLHQDQQGSTRLLTDGGGNVVGRYDYSPWGAVASYAGSASTNLQFDGEFTDAETGFQYLRARYYDPSTGQFLARDPAANLTRSRYGFALSDPVDSSDPSGLWAVGWCVGGSGTVPPGITAQGELCTWEGGTGWWPTWTANTFTVTGGGGVGLRAGISGEVGLVVDGSASKPDDLAGPGCTVGGSVHAIAGVSGSVGCNLDSIGISLDLGLEAGGSVGGYLGATNVLSSSTGFKGWGPKAPRIEPLCNQQAYDPYWNIA
ncbi:MAG TPA: RHS repeat-associated core domain-containing protein, partial [Solirubrobacterales bacterium]|nr:RHS repeat-associated core domain-containing protein [Solirubrobacterales bacterium]